MSRFKGIAANKEEDTEKALEQPDNLANENKHTNREEKQTYDH